MSESTRAPDTARPPDKPPGTPTRNLNGWRDMILSEHGPPSATMRIVLLAVGRRVNLAEGRTFAGAPDLGRLSACDERTVRRALKDAHALGWVVVEERTGRTPYTYPAFPPGVTPGTESGVEGWNPGQKARTSPDSAPGAEEATPDSVSAHPGQGARTPRTESPTNSGSNSGSNSECDPWTYTDPNGWSWSDLEPLGKRCAHGPLMPRINDEDGTLFLGCRHYAETGCKVTYDPRSKARERARAADASLAARLDAASTRTATDVATLAGRHVRAGQHAGRPMTAREIEAEAAARRQAV